MKTIELEFIGYYDDRNDDEIIDTSGIYCVYAVKSKHQVRLIYIGESENVRTRLIKHNRYDDWVNELTKGEKLYFSYAKASSTDRERAEAALINYHVPPLNDEHTINFSYLDTTIKLSGDILELSEEFTVYRT